MQHNTTFADEVLESYFISLGKAESYARAQLAYLRGLGPLPQPKDFCVRDGEAQAVRIRLAQYF